jgi:hypothetical protein
VETVAQLVGWVFGFLAAHPKLILGFLAAGVIGSTITGKKMTPAGLRSRFGWAANFLILALALVGGTSYVYKHRKDAGRGMLAAAGAVAVVVWVWSVEHSPDGWTPFLIFGSCAALIWLALGPLAKEIGDRKISEWFADTFLRRKLAHAAGTVLEGTTVHRTEARADGTLVAHVQLPAGGRIDQLHPEAVGSALARQGLPIEVANVSVHPGAKAGQGTVVVSPKPVDTAWNILRTVDNDWPGPNGDDPKLPIPLGPCVLPDGTVGVAEVPSSDELEAHILIGGATRAGKSQAMGCALGTLAYRRHTQFLLLDPDRVEFRPLEPRALRVAKGPLQCHQALRWAVAEMDRRAEWMDQRGIRHWLPGVHGPELWVVVDELAALTDSKDMAELPVDDRTGDEMKPARVVALNNDAVDQLLARGLKRSIRLILATQRPGTDVIKGRSRDNCGLRIALAHESGVGARMTLGEDENRPDPTKIPLWLPGGAYVRVERGVYLPTRGFYMRPRKPCANKHEALTVALEEIAAETAHLRDERLTYPIGD